MGYNNNNSSFSIANNLSRRPCIPDCQQWLKKESDQNKCCSCCCSRWANGAVVWGSWPAANTKMVVSDDNVTCVGVNLGKESHHQEVQATLLTWEVTSHWNIPLPSRFDDRILQQLLTFNVEAHIYWTTVLPTKLLETILRKMHSNITSGYLRVKKSLLCLRKRFYCVGMWNGVEVMSDVWGGLC